jgi:hypothetical protein
MGSMLCSGIVGVAASSPCLEGSAYSTAREARLSPTRGVRHVVLPKLTGKPTVLLHRGATLQATASRVVTMSFRLDGGHSGVFLPLFFIDEQPKEFIRSLGELGNGMVVYQLEEFAALEQLLVDSKERGCTHVNFNADRKRPNPIPVDDVLDSLRNRPKG